MKKVKLCILGLLVFVLLVTPLVASCTDETSVPEDETPVPEDETPVPEDETSVPETGGTLKIILTSIPFNNLGTPESHLGPNGYLRLCMETLLKFEQEGGFSPSLATSWEMSSDNMSLTMSLRQGVTFHDGTDFDAEAAKYCLDIYKDTRSEFASVESVDVLDSYEIRLNFSNPDSSIFSALAKRSFMFSPTAREELGEDGNVNYPVGTGPFQFESYTADVSYKVTKFEDYWQEGKPYLDGIELVFISDVTTANLSFLAGEADAIWLTTPIEMQEIVNAGEYNFNKAVVLVECIGGDATDPSSPYADVRVRQAISYAIDKEAIVDAMGYGIFQATDQFALPGDESYSTDLVGYSYDPDKAIALLEDAGYGDGFETTIYSQPGDQLEQAFTAVQGYLADVGITANLDIMDMAAWQQSATGGWEDGLMLCPTQAGSCVDFLNQMKTSYSQTAKFFPDVVKSDELDALLDEGLQEFDEETRVAIMHDVQEMMIDDLCMVTVLYASYYACASQSYVKDLDLLDQLDSDWNPADAWISSE